MQGAGQDLLRAANRELKQCLSRDLGHDPAGPARLQKLLDLVRSIGDRLEPQNGQGATLNPASTDLLSEYRVNLERMQHALTHLQGNLQHRRRELEAEESQLRAAQNWANGYRNTF